jgi:hypothetical protein
MPGRVLRLDNLALRYVIIGVGLTWSAAFAAIALFFSPVAGLDLDTAMSRSALRDIKAKRTNLTPGSPSDLKTLKRARSKCATTRPCSPTPVIKHSINECPVIAKTFRDPMDEDLQSRFGAGPTLGYEGRRQRPALWPALPFG